MGRRISKKLPCKVVRLWESFLLDSERHVGIEGVGFLDLLIFEEVAGRIWWVDKSRETCLARM